MKVRLDTMKALRRFNNTAINELLSGMDFDEKRARLLIDHLRLHRQILQDTELEKRIEMLEAAIIEEV